MTDATTPTTTTIPTPTTTTSTTITTTCGSSNTRTPTLTILSSLDVYSQIHERTNVKQKMVLWEITKARRSKTRGGALMDGVLLADNVRQELRGTTRLDVLADTEEGGLIDKDNNNNSSNRTSTRTSTSTSTSTQEKNMVCNDTMTGQLLFTLVNVHDNDKKKKMSTEEQKATSTLLPKTNLEEGLRRRKGQTTRCGANTDECEKDGNNWAGSEVTDNDNDDDEEEEEEKRLIVEDPLDLFGAMPPTELRKAQKEAKQVLEGYVEAANLIVALQQQMTSTTTK